MSELNARFVTTGEFDSDLLNGDAFSTSIDDYIVTNADMAEKDSTIDAMVDSSDTLNSGFGEVIRVSDGGGSDYNDLFNKPKINGVTVEGDKSGWDYNLQHKLIAGEHIEIGDDGVTISTPYATYQEVMDILNM